MTILDQRNQQNNCWKNISRETRLTNEENIPGKKIQVNSEDSFSPNPGGLCTLCKSL